MNLAPLIARLIVAQEQSIRRYRWAMRTLISIGATLVIVAVASIVVAILSPHSNDENKFVTELLKFGGGLFSGIFTGAASLLPHKELSWRHERLELFVSMRELIDKGESLSPEMLQLLWDALRGILGGRPSA
jgi:hypothetical protein